MRNFIKGATGLALAGALAAGPVMSQTHTETIVAEQRMSVSVRISPEAAQAFMPAGWTPASPSLSVIFMDRTLQLTPDGRPLGAGTNQLLVLVMGARNAAGETRSMVVGGYSSDPSGAPGAYKTYRQGAVSVARREQKGPDGIRVEEQWSARGEDGDLTLDLAYTRGVASLSPLNLKVYSGAEPDFYRNYRGQQASEVLRGGSSPDRIQSVRLTASGGRLGRAIDGSEQIVSITSTPFYTRQTFVP